MRIVALLIVPVLAYLCSCVPAAVKPMQTRVVSASTCADTPVLIYLPGIEDSIMVFEANGMVDSLETAGIEAEVVLCNAHFGYYAKRTLPERIKEDALLPSIERGHSTIWFVGNSLGGLGSLHYAWKHPGAIKGIVLLGPYISRGRIAREIKKAGGLKSWNPVVTDTTDWERQLWLWLKRCTLGGDSSCPKIFLGYGQADRFAKKHELLAGVLPPQNVVAIEGGHDWPIWRRAWGELLRRGALK